ncbi:MAG: dipeptidase [Bacteroidota bacterium]
MNFRILFASVAVGSFATALSQTTDDQLRAKAQKLAHDFLLVDTHIDVPEHIREVGWQDLSRQTPDGEFDYVRAVQGGLNVPFLAVYIPAEEEKAGTAKKTAEELIDMVRKFAAEWPDKFSIATSVSDVTSQFNPDRVSLCMGMENGSPIEGKLENVRHFYERGIRYITLCHAKDNHICDSSYDTTRTWHGLSPFGRQVVAEMNRVGIMVDISHVSDDAFYQTIRLTKAPVIASHSSCRFFTPGFERNMSDDMIRELAQNGGVIQINFGSDFLKDEYRTKDEASRIVVANYLKEHNLAERDSAGRAYIREYYKAQSLPLADVKDVVAHIDHVVKLVGIDHVGIGSDFDGVGDSLPTGLKDVSYYPNLLYELLKAGYSDPDIRKICSGNLLRVWSAVEKTAKDLSTKE